MTGNMFLDQFSDVFLIFPKTMIFQLQNGIFTLGILPVEQVHEFFEILFATFPKRCVYPYSENLSTIEIKEYHRVLVLILIVVNLPS